MLNCAVLEHNIMLTVSVVKPAWRQLVTRKAALLLQNDHDTLNETCHVQKKPDAVSKKGKQHIEETFAWWVERNTFHILTGFLEAQISSFTSFILGLYVICSFIKPANVYITRLKQEVFLKIVLLYYHFIIYKQSHSQSGDDNI